MNENNTNKSTLELSKTTAEIALKKARTRITVAMTSIVLLTMAFFWFKSWSAEQNLDYIEGNVMTIARSSTASAGSPWNGASFISMLVWESLFCTDATFTEINPVLADKIEISPDGLTYTITMKDGLQWSDGEPLTVDDVVFSIEAVLLNSGGTPVYMNPLQQIKGAEEWQEIGYESWEKGGTHSLEGISTDGNQVIIELDAPYSSFAIGLTQFVIYPKHALEDYDPTLLIKVASDELFNFFQFPVCSGMYMPELINEDGDLELVHNPYYYGTHSDIERVVLYGEYQSKHIDYYTTSSVTEMVSYRNMTGFDEYSVNVLFYRYLVLNLTGGYDNPTMVPLLDEDGKEVLDDDDEVVMVAEYGEDREANLPMLDYRVRQAISLAIDRQSILKEVYIDNGDVSFDNTGNAEYVEFLAEQNLEKAKELLLEAEYDMDRPIIIKHYHTDANSIAMLARIESALESIGLTVEVIWRTGGNTEIFETREFDLYLKGYAGHSPYEWYIEYLSYTAYLQDLLGTDEFDDLYLDLQSAINQEEYDKAWAAMQELDRTTMYRIPVIATNDSTYINANRISVPDDMEFGNIRYRSDLRLDEWYVKKG